MIMCEYHLLGAAAAVIVRVDNMCHIIYDPSINKD